MSGPRTMAPLHVVRTTFCINEKENLILNTAKWIVYSKTPCISKYTIMTSFLILSCAQRSVAEVEWRETKKKNIYRAGHLGKVRKNPFK